MKRFLVKAALLIVIGLCFLYFANDRLDRLFAKEQKDSGTGSQIFLDDGWVDVQKIAGQKETGRVVDHELFFLLTGVDQNDGKTSDTTRSDTMMLVKVDFDKSTVDILSLPRDSRTKVQGEMTKLNHAHAYGGIDLTMKTIRDWLDVDLDYYVEVSFEAVKQIVDTMGGVEYTIPSDVKYEYWTPEKGNQVIPPGKQKLNGEQALGFVRFRKGYANGDLGRVQAQQNFLKVIINQALSKEHIGNLVSYVKTYFDTVHTNIPFNQLIGLVSQASAMKNVQIRTHVLPGEPDMIDDVSYYIVDEQKAKEMVRQVLPNYVLIDMNSNGGKDAEKSEE